MPTTPMSAAGQTMVTAVLPLNLVHDLAERRGISLAPEHFINLRDKARIDLLYGLPGDSDVQDSIRIFVAKALTEHPPLSVGVGGVIVATGGHQVSVAMAVELKDIVDLWVTLLETFPLAKDPYRVAGWVPHITLGRAARFDSWVRDIQATRNPPPIALPIEAVEIWRGDGVIERLTPFGGLVNYG